ncbi:MAG: hypothetical protein H0X29_11490 [Parachlamydiaceae bacterium]|nr:hypothetical protein [Parachlamydiaceae bacterium]
MTTNIIPDQLPDNVLFTAPPSLPYMPHLPVFAKHRQIEYNRETHAVVDIDLFHEIEKMVFLPSFSPAAKKSFSDPISLLISGPLANKKLVNNPLEKDEQKKLFSEINTQLPQHIFYSVLVDEQSGRIFWHEPLQSIENANIQSLATKILYELQFTTTPSAFVTAGQVELHFSNPHMD